MALNDTRLRTLKPKPGKTERLVADGNGLYVRIRVGEGEVASTWQFRRREGGRLTHHDARHLPGTADPRSPQAGARTRDQAHDVPPDGRGGRRAVADRAHRTHAPQGRAGARLHRAGHRAGAGLPARARHRALGDRRVIRAYRDRAAKSAKGRKGGPRAGRALLGVLKGLFGYAVANGWIKLSPAAQLTAAMVGAPSAARTRVLSDDEIRYVMTLDGPQGPVLRFLLATGLRIGEAYGGHREGQYWVVPSARLEEQAASTASGCRRWPWRSSNSIPGRCVAKLFRTG